MALAVSVRFDFQDAKGKKSFTKVRVPTGFASTNYAAFAAGMAQFMANISTGQITRVSFCVGIDLSGATIKAVPSGLSDIAQKVIVGFSTAVQGLRTKMKLPAISSNMLTAPVIIFAHSLLTR